MTFKSLTLSVAALALATGCAQANDAAQKAVQAGSQTANQATTSVSQRAKDAVVFVPGANIAEAPAGIYKSEETHAYITFQYLHQGYARPTLRWNEFDATIDLNPSNPTDSKLSVTIDAASIDSGVERFDQHLVSADFFDVENHSEITFVSTSLSQTVTGSGTLNGMLTMKGISKPVTLDVKLNKVGEHFQTKKPIIGISASTQIKRSEWDLGLYTPLVGDEVDISIEIEFVKDDA